MHSMHLQCNHRDDQRPPNAHKRAQHNKTERINITFKEKEKKKKERELIVEGNGIGAYNQWDRRGSSAWTRGINGAGKSIEIPPTIARIVEKLSQ